VRKVYRYVHISTELPNAGMKEGESKLGNYVAVAKYARDRRKIAGWEAEGA
jgi:hypothetical protein